MSGEQNKEIVRRFLDGYIGGVHRIAEAWVTDDALSLFIQLGPVPMPGAGGA